MLCDLNMLRALHRTVTAAGAGDRQIRLNHFCRLRKAVAVNDGYEIFDLSKQQVNLPPFPNEFSVLSVSLHSSLSEGRDEFKRYLRTSRLPESRDLL